MKILIETNESSVMYAEDVAKEMGKQFHIDIGNKLEGTSGTFIATIRTFVYDDNGLKYGQKGTLDAWTGEFTWENDEGEERTMDLMCAEGLCMADLLDSSDTIAATDEEGRDVMFCIP